MRGQAFCAGQRAPRCAGTLGRCSRRAQPLARPVAAQAATATASAKSLDALKSWAQSKGAKLEKVELSTDILTDQPILVATADVQAGETLMVLPDAAWLSPEAAQRGTVGKLAASAGLDPWLQISLQLVADRFGQGAPQSEFKAYADSLPQQLASPLAWSLEEQKELQGTQLMQSLSGYMAFFRSTFQQLQAGLFAQQPAAFPPSAFTLDNFLWAVAVVRSRSHAPLDGPKIALAPLADLVSHRRSGNTRWSVRSAGLGLFGRGQVLALEAAKPLRKGDQLSMDYGAGKLDNAVMLDYGVLDSREPKAGYNLSLTLPSTDRFFDDKVDILETNKLSQTVNYNLTTDKEPSEEMMGFLRLMNLSGMDAFLLESIFRNDVWGFMLEPVSEGNEEAVCAAMAAGAREALAGYPTTIDEDLALQRSGGYAPGSRKEAALLVRLGEKEALDAALRFFEERRTTQLKRLVYYQERRLRRLGLVDDEGRTTYDSFFKDGIA